MDRDEIDASLAARLVAGQFPEWAELPVVPVEPGGWDNRTFRLGDTMSVRLPSAKVYVPGVEKELTWLPRLAPRLPLPIPAPLAVGAPAGGYPWPWSVRRWLDGRPATRDGIGDMSRLARDLAAFLLALQEVDATGGPAAGAHSFHRGAWPGVYDSETRAAIETLAPEVDADAATEVWEAAIAEPWTGAPVWFHGDVVPGNLLLDGAGTLTAVLDFGTCGVGDPACDLVIAWTLLDGDGREEFRSRMRADSATWARARGWALWKALITAVAPGVTWTTTADARAVIDHVLADHAAR